MSLEAINPETALEMYLADKANDLADASRTAREYRLDHFVRWCNLEGVWNLNELTGRRLHEYRLWRRDEGDLNKVTEKTQIIVAGGFALTHLAIGATLRSEKFPTGGEEPASSMAT